MDLPQELPKELHYLGVAKDSKTLLEMLSSLPSNLITFFEIASEDAPWCARHQDFIKALMRWITQKSFEEKLSRDFAQRFADTIRKNFNVIRSYLYRDLFFEVKGMEIAQSSLLWSTTCDYLHELIRVECREKKSSKVFMENISFEIFEQIQEFVETGEVSNLWRKSENEILEVFRDASDWKIKGLMVDCEIILKRYITPETVFQTLFRAHFNKWLHLKLTCMEYINNLNLGFYFDVEHIHHLSVEIFNFQRKTLAAFKHLEKVITHLNLGGSLAEDAEFTELIHQCPKLIGIGFKESDSFSEKFLEVSQTIYDLDLSKCAWLNAEYLQRFARAYPKLKSIDLSNNYDLAYDDWASLHEFKSLESVDISRCHQVKNDDFTIIFHSCRNIKKFSMVECLQVNDDLFSEIGKMMTVLTDLNISKCNISDTALVELSTRCNDLYFLNLSRCPNLSERGIMEAIRHLASLYELNVTNCRISENAIDNFKKLRPMLKIID